MQVNRKDFRQLKVWEKAHQLALEVYKATAMFPKEELYRLMPQLRRASVSIPTNIAERCGRNTDADFARFLQIAIGPASEPEYEILLAFDLGFLSKTQFVGLQGQAEEVKKMLASFLKTLRTDR